MQNLVGERIQPKEAAKLLARTLYAEDPAYIRLNSKGRTNRVYEVRVPQGVLMVRLHDDPNGVVVFEKAARALERVRDKAVPVPNILHVGNTLIPYSYMLYPKIKGTVLKPEHQDAASVWRQVGALMRRVHSISAKGYGRMLFWQKKRQRYTETWAEYLTPKLEDYVKTYRHILAAELGEQLLSRIDVRLQSMRSWKFDPVYIHGDLTLRNVIVGKSGQVSGIIDWDNLLFSRAPHHDIALGRAEMGGHLNAFLEGYGISKHEWEGMRYEVESLELLKYLDDLIWFNYTNDALSRSTTKASINRIMQS